jgi:hypothetical protein
MEMTDGNTCTSHTQDVPCAGIWHSVESSASQADKMKHGGERDDNAFEV